MAEDLASLGIQVDSSSVPAATTSLDALSAAGSRAEASTEALTAATVTSQRQMTAAAQATRNNLSSLLAMQQYANKGAADGAAANVAKRASQEAAESMRALYRATAPLAPVQEQVAQTQARVAKTAGELKQAYRQLPSQITDIVTSLASGQKPYMVLIQQGGQLKDSFGGIGAAARALASKLSLGTVAAAAAAIGVGVLATGYAQAEAEQNAFYRAQILSNGVSGATVETLNAEAKALAGIIGTRGQASAVLAQLAQSGKVGVGQLQDAAEVAIRLQKSAGISVDETVKAFVRLGREPTAGLKALNDQYHFLTAATYSQVRALEDEGRTTEAAALAQSTYSRAMNDRGKSIEKSLGSLQVAGQKTGELFKWMWDTVVGAGRPRSEDEQRADIDSKILNLTEGIDSGEFAGMRKRWIAERDALQKQRDQKTALDSANDQDEKRRQSRQLAQDRLIEADHRKAAEEVQKTARDAASAEASRAAVAAGRIAAIQRDLSAETGAYDNQQKLLDAQHDAGLISDKAYYAERRRLIQGTSDAQVHALEAENIALKAQSLATEAEVQKAQAKVDALRVQGGPEYEAAAKRLDEAEQRATEVRLQNAEKTKANMAEMAQVTASTATQTKVLGIVEDSRLENLKKGYAAARAAADDYLATLAKQYALQERDQFAGDQARDFSGGQSAIEEKYAQQRQELERARNQALQTNADPSRKQEIEDDYRQRLQITQDSLAKELALYKDHWSKLRAGEASAANGMREALANYSSEASNVAKQAADVWTKALHGTEDALTSLATGGKAKFKELANSIIQDIARIQIKAMLSNLAQGLFGGGGWLSSLGGGGGIAQRAAGGNVEPNTPYIVGEKGPEMRVFSRAGSIVPNHKLGGGGPQFSITMHNSPGVDAAQMLAFGDQLVEKIRNVIPMDASRSKYGWGRA